MLAFVIKDLKSQTVQYAPNHNRAILAEKARYLKPFKLENEKGWPRKPAKPATIETLSKPIEEKEDNNAPTADQDSKLPHYQQALLKVCQTSSDKPLYYNSTSKVVNNKTAWQTTVAHDNNLLHINSSGEASTKSASREQAAKNAAEHLTNNPLSASKVQRDEQSANLVGEEKDDELVDLIVTTKNNTNDDDTESPEHFSEQQRAIIQKKTKTTLEICFQGLFEAAINSMTTKFDERIQNIVDEAYEQSFKSTLQNEIREQVQKQTSQTIQEAVKEEVESKVTDIMKEKLQNAVFNTIFTRAQTECAQIFKNQFVLKVNNTTKESELNIERKQLEAIERIQDESKACTNSLTQLNIRDRADINTRREQFSKQIHKDFENMIRKLESEADDHISNMNEVGDAIKVEIMETKLQQSSSQPDHIPSRQSLYHKNEEVCFQDSVTGQQCSAWVIDEHGDDMDNVFYNIRFANNNTIRTAQENIRKLEKQIHKLFPNVDADKIMSTVKPLHTVPMQTTQFHFDQLNALATYLQAIKLDETFLDNDLETPLLNLLQVKKSKGMAQFIRKQLKQRQDWIDWKNSEHKQLDLYQMQNVFGRPMAPPPGANILNLLWTYGIKADSTKKAQCVYNGNPRRKGTVTLAHTSAACLEQPGARSSWSSAAYFNMLVLGADAFAEASAPKDPLYVVVDQQFREWWRQQGQEDIPEG